MAELNFPAASASPWTAPNGVIYTYEGLEPNGYWKGSTTDIDGYPDVNDGTGSTLDTRYVKKSGTSSAQNISGSGGLRLNKLNVNNQITLNSNGTANFNGAITLPGSASGSQATSYADVVSYVNNQGFIDASSAPVQSVNGETGIVVIDIPDSSSFVPVSGATMTGDLKTGTAQIYGYGSGNRKMALTNWAFLAVTDNPAYDYGNPKPPTPQRANEAHVFKVDDEDGNTYAQIMAHGSFFCRRAAGDSSAGKICLETGVHSTPTHRTIQLDTVDGFRHYINTGDATINALRIDTSTGTKAYIRTDGTAQIPGVTFMLGDLNDPASYESETTFQTRKAAILAANPEIDPEEITKEYIGPTLDVKERILNFQSRLAAMEANEVIDDATDNALLQLVANLSSEVDALKARVNTLEGG